MFKNYEAIKVGDSAKLVRKIGMEDIKKFVDMTGDDNRLHIDREYAKTTSFKDIVVHGMLGASFISTIIGTQLPGDGALWVSQTLEFLLPVRLGDVLTVSATVLQKFDRERLLELETLVTNQNGRVVLSGKGKVRVLEVAVENKTNVVAKQKVAVISGGAGGIGQSIAKTLAKEGYRVVVNYNRSADAAQQLVKEIEGEKGIGTAIQGDVSSPEEANALIQQVCRLYGTVSLLVNNASPKINPKTFDKLQWQDIQLHLDVQLRGAFNLAHACVPVMKAQGYGKMINITSQVLDGLPSSGWTAYAIGKAALATFSKHLASELGPFGIHVNCISPGMTDTGFIGDIPEKARLIIARQTPLRRLASTEDVASAVSFLASDKADFITGETLRLNGGQVML